MGDNEFAGVVNKERRVPNVPIANLEIKCAKLEEIGIDPKKFQSRNPLFFHNIMQRMEIKDNLGSDKVPDTFYWPEGDEELWKKNQPKPRPKNETMLAKLQKIRGKWSKSKEQALAIAELTAQEEAKVKENEEPSTTTT